MKSATYGPVQEKARQKWVQKRPGVNKLPRVSCESNYWDFVFTLRGMLTTKNVVVPFKTHHLSLNFDHSGRDNRKFKEKNRFSTDSYRNWLLSTKITEKTGRKRIMSGRFHETGLIEENCNEIGYLRGSSRENGRKMGINKDPG